MLFFKELPEVARHCAHSFFSGCSKILCNQISLSVLQLAFWIYPA